MTSLRLSFFICKMGPVIAFTSLLCENYIRSIWKHLIVGPGISSLWIVHFLYVWTAHTYSQKNTFVRVCSYPPSNLLLSKAFLSVDFALPDLIATNLSLKIHLMSSKRKLKILLGDSKIIKIRECSSSWTTDY